MTHPLLKVVGSHKLPLKSVSQVDLNEEWVIPEGGGESKCGWTPYAGLKVRGRVQKVVIRGEEAYVDGVVSSKRFFSSSLFHQRFSNPLLDPCPTWLWNKHASTKER